MDIKELDVKGYKEFTQIQKRVIPVALEGNNVIGKSATGSGKTDAFLVPAFNTIDDTSLDLQVIVIAPTRELASQIYKNALEYVECNEKIRVKLFTGGFERKKDLTNNNAQIVIGTPARLKDVLIDNAQYDVSKVKMIVLDEIDMIFEMKFLEDIDAIMALMDKQVQTLAFSATINGQLRHFISKYMKTKEIIEIGKKKETSSLVTHYAIPLRRKTRKDALLNLLKNINPYFCLIFASKKEDVDVYFKVLRQEGYNVGVLHGDLDSRVRRQTMKKIENFEYQYVVCSDIASRGIDIEGVSQVISMDFPTHLEYYYHRSGRCGRANESGDCYSFYDEKDLVIIRQLINKGLDIQNVEYKNDELRVLSPFVKEKRAKKVDTELEKEIRKIVNKRQSKKNKVKPGYKKKIKMEIDKAKKKRKREIIKADIKKRQRERAIKRTKGEL